MKSQEKRSENERAIRALIDELKTAIRVKDINGVMAAYAPEIVAFDIVPPLQYLGVSAFKKPWEEVFKLYEGSINYEIHDLHIIAGDDVAFSHSLNRLNGTMKNGARTDLWLRWTAGYRRFKDKWLIVHLQASVPVDLGTGKAMLELHQG